MSIKFTRVPPPTDATPASQPPPEPATLRWVPLAVQSDIEEQLFNFVRLLLEGRPQAGHPLLVEPATLAALYQRPRADLVEALRRCVDHSLLMIRPGGWPALAVSPALLGLTLAAYTALTPSLVADDRIIDPLDAFGVALAASLPPARALPELLAYHAVLQPLAAALPRLTGARAALLTALLDRSPLTALYHLDLVAPPPLWPLAAELVRDWPAEAPPPSCWSELGAWLDVLAPALADPALSLYLRRRWLSQPETYQACRNQGLFLEALRRRGSYRLFLLAFYEAYDYFAGQWVESAAGKERRWPLLDDIEALLRAEGDSQAAYHLHRRGQEYFLRFAPLVAVISADGRPPTDFNLLSLALLQRLRSLMNWVSEGAVPRLNLNTIEYGDGRAI